MYWAQYVLVEQALRGGDTRSTECPSSYPTPRREGAGYCNRPVCLSVGWVVDLSTLIVGFSVVMSVSVCLSVQASTPLIVGRF